MTKFSLLGLFMFLSLGGCSKSSNVDIATDPTAINRPGITDKELTMWGVHLGDPASNIPADRVLETNDKGMKKCKRERWFRVDDGKVVQFIILGHDDLAAFRVKSEEEIRDVFGEPDHMVTESAYPNDPDPLHVYVYRSRRLKVTWTSGSFGPISIGERLQ